MKRYIVPETTVLSVLASNIICESVVPAIFAPSDEGSGDDAV